MRRVPATQQAWQHALTVIEGGAFHRLDACRRGREGNPGISSLANPAAFYGLNISAFRGRKYFMRSSIIPRVTVPRLAAVGASLAVAGTLLGAGLAGSATAATAATATAAAGHASARSAAAAPKPTIVLVHGAWADSSSWNGVIERLQALGYTVDAPPNPLSGVSSDSAYLSDFLSTISGPIILVGHSYGGFVITNAATGNPQVKALVYDDAFIPAAGDTPESLSSAMPGSCLTSTALHFVPYPGAPSGDSDVYVNQNVFPGCFANGLPASEGAALAAEQQPPVASILSDTLTTAPAWQTIPSWDVIGTADHVIPPAEQVAMAQRAGSHITEIDAPHLSMISDPGAVTRVILDAARTVG
jgi:pimeloyl-ACP methyl ester carboxylesterase